MQKHRSARPQGHSILRPGPLPVVRSSLAPVLATLCAEIARRYVSNLSPRWPQKVVGGALRGPCVSALLLSQLGNGSLGSSVLSGAVLVDGPRCCVTWCPIV